MLYRADGGHPIGTGHLYRAARLLSALEARGGLEAHLLTAEDPAARRMAPGIPARLTWLPPRTDMQAVKPRLAAGPVAEELAQQPYDLVVVDMLDTARQDMAAIAEYGVPLLTFDDRGDGRASADTLVNILVEEPHPESLPGTRLLEGGPYVVLDPVFAGLRSRPLPPRAFGRLDRVLVAMGGADAAGLTVKVAEALCRVGGIDEVDFVSGPAFPHRTGLDAVLSSAPWRYRVHMGLPNLVEQYLSCDLAVVAGGLTMYEVCCSGTPALAVCQPIDHQLELAARLTAAGAMRTVGYGVDASLESIADAMVDMADPEVRRAMAACGPGIVDGRGTQRVADVMQETACVRRRSP